MKVFFDCLPCLLRQALEAARMVTNNRDLQAVIMEEAIKIITEYKKYNCSPEIAKDIHRIIKESTGDPDPYDAIKRYDIKKAKEIYPLLKEFLYKKND
ncbi:MAG TPA: ARMT1-like domain-containing protein, partial [Bacillota bacterium]|nr:ARMT1-like domain-containing protein [Bacillota bacterium]